MVCVPIYLTVTSIKMDTNASERGHPLPTSPEGRYGESANVFSRKLVRVRAYGPSEISQLLL